MNIFNFLLPQTNMDYVFFGLLIFWFSFSLFAAWQAKNNVKKCVQSSSFKKVKASVTELSIALRHPFWDHVTDNAAGFALVLGLLGTFLGIGLAISGAGQILANMGSDVTNATDMRQTVGSLSPMLAEIGLKFKCSAWGIIVHIALRIIIPIFQIDKIRSEAILNQLETEAENAEELDSKRWKKVFQLLQSQNDHLETIADVDDTFSNSVKSLQESVKVFEKTVSHFDKNVTYTLEQMHNSVTMVTKNLQDSIEMMRAEVENTFSQFRNDVSHTLSKVGTDISESSLAIKSSVDSLSENVAKELQNVALVTTSLTSHSRDMASTIKEQQHYLNEMSNKVGEIASKGADYGFSLESVTDNIQKLTGADGIIAEQLTKVAANTQAMNSNLEVLRSVRK